MTRRAARETGAATGAGTAARTGRPGTGGGPGELPLSATVEALPFVWLLGTNQAIVTGR